MDVERTFLFVVDWIRAGTGGFASLMDLMTELDRQGHRIVLVRIGFSPRFWRSSRKPELPDSFELVEAPGLDLYLAQRAKDKKSKSTPHAVPTMRERIRRWAYQPFRMFNTARLEQSLKRIHEADILINASSLSGDGLRKLRDGGLMLVQNHAGSKEAYARYFLGENQRFPDAANGLDLYTSFCSGFHVLLFQSGEQAGECARHHDLLRNRTFTLRPSADTSSMDLARAQPSPFRPGSVNIVMVGTIQPRKAQETAVRVLHAVRQRGVDASLHIVGGVADPAYATLLDARIQELKLDGHVFLHGHRDDHIRFMAHADALLQTSHAEGVSRAVREAMYLKLPIVSFMLPGLEEYLGDEGAFLENHGDVEALTEALGIALSDKVESRRRADTSRAVFDTFSSPKAYTGSVARFVDHLNTLGKAE